MTELESVLLIVGIGGMATATAVVAIEPVRRAIRRHRAARTRTDQESVHPDPRATLVPPAPTRRVPVPVLPDARDDATRPTAGPVRHAGADETWSPLAEIGTLAERPLDPDEARQYAALTAHEARMATLYETCAAEIGAALARFTAGYDIDLSAVQPAVSIEVALIRIRWGVLEPAEVPRTTLTETGELDVRALRALLAAEDQAVATW